MVGRWDGRKREGRGGGVGSDGEEVGVGIETGIGAMRMMRGEVIGGIGQDQERGRGIDQERGREKGEGRSTEEGIGIPEDGHAQDRVATTDDGGRMVGIYTLASGGKEVSRHLGERGMTQEIEGMSDGVETPKEITVF